MEKSIVNDFKVIPNDEFGCRKCYFGKFRNCDSRKPLSKGLRFELHEKYGCCIMNNHVYILKENK